MFNLKRHIRITEQTHIVANNYSAAIVVEARPQVEVDWRSIKQDARAIVRRGLAWLREVAVQSDVSLAALTLAVGYAR